MLGRRAESRVSSQDPVEGADERVGVAMELLNIEIDQESQQEAIYHVLLLPTSMAIWPIVHPE